MHILPCHYAFIFYHVIIRLYFEVKNHHNTLEVYLHNTLLKRSNSNNFNTKQIITIPASLYLSLLDKNMLYFSKLNWMCDHCDDFPTLRFLPWYCHLLYKLSFWQLSRYYLLGNCVIVLHSLNQNEWIT